MSRTNLMRVVRDTVCLLLTVSGLFTLPVYGQTLTGKWAGTWRVLDNGENDRMYLDLQQTNTQVTGTVTTIGHVWQVKGTIAETRFELFFSQRDGKPRVTGDIVGNELHLTREGDQFVAVPAKPGDEYSASEHILLAGNDVRTMKPAIKEILLNREVLAIDQDSLGKQAVPVKNGDLEMWVKRLADGSVAVGVVNMSTAAATASVKAHDLGLSGKVNSARDLWKHASVPFHDGVYTANIPSHGVLLLRVSAAGAERRLQSL